MYTFSFKTSSPIIAFTIILQSSNLMYLTDQGTLTHIWLILQLLNKLNMRAKIRNLSGSKSPDPSGHDGGVDLNWVGGIVIRPSCRRLYYRLNCL